MTLGRLIVAWLAVAAWFAVAALGIARVLGTDVPSRRALAWRAAEAFVVTLLGSLWFNSLGRGEWWLVFGLIGAIAAAAGDPARDATTRATLVAVCAMVARYVVAGALLAWRLG